MLIQLRQSEIEEALKMYVTRQGFSLVGKSVEIAFTASRGNNGITADLDITDAGGLHAVQAQAPVVTLDVGHAGTAGEIEEAPAVKETVFQEAAHTPDEPEEVAEEQPASSASLFS